MHEKSTGAVKPCIYMNCFGCLSKCSTLGRIYFGAFSTPQAVNTHHSWWMAHMSVCNNLHLFFWMSDRPTELGICRARHHTEMGAFVTRLTLLDISGAVCNRPSQMDDAPSYKWSKQLVSSTLINEPSPFHHRAPPPQVGTWNINPPPFRRDSPSCIQTQSRSSRMARIPPMSQLSKK